LISKRRCKVPTSTALAKGSKAHAKTYAHTNYGEERRRERRCMQTTRRAHAQGKTTIGRKQAHAHTHTPTACMQACTPDLGDK